MSKLSQTKLHLVSLFIISFLNKKPVFFVFTNKNNPFLTVTGTDQNLIVCTHILQAANFKSTLVKFQSQNIFIRKYKPFQRVEFSSDHAAAIYSATRLSFGYELLFQKMPGSM